MTQSVEAAPGTDRILALDTVRGIAVMGILAMNIVAFAMPFPAYVNPRAYGGSSGLDLLSWLLNFLLFDGKMRGLFSMLFGASTLLVIERATRSGRGAAWVHYRRMIVLLLFGCLHFYFLWYGDILALYALCGMLLYFFRDLSPRRLVAWAVGFMTISMAFFSLIGVSAMAAGSPGSNRQADSPLMEARRSIEAEFGQTSPKVAEELKLYRSDYASIVHHRLVERTGEPFASFLTFGFETLGLMLIGMALFRTGFFTGSWATERYVRWAITSAGIALPALALLAWSILQSEFEVGLLFGSFIAWTMPFDTLMAIAWASLTILWLKSGQARSLQERVAAAGRMAFTNYLTTTLVMTSLFYGYGAGLFGEVGRTALWLPVLGMWALMLAWSKPWLERFRYGPLEWLWRSLSRWEVQPLRRPLPA